MLSAVNMAVYPLGLQDTSFGIFEIQMKGIRIELRDWSNEPYELNIYYELANHAFVLYILN
jgi:hypothetical protein